MAKKAVTSQLHQRKAYRQRIKFVMLGFVCLFTLILARLYSFQVLDHKRLMKAVEEQIYRKVKIPAHRGDIRDRNGIVLATSIFRETLYLDPAKFGKQEFEITRAIASGIGMTRSELVSKIGKGVTPVARRIASSDCERILQQADAIKPKLNFGAVFSRKVSARSYPKGALGANLIGFCQVEPEEGDNQGVAGLEKSLEAELQGKDQYQKLLVNRFGQSIEPMDENRVLASHGNSVELTIDAQIQHFAEDALQRRVVDAGGKAGACVVLDPRNGDLLAIASYPSFLPQDIRTRDPQGTVNRAFERPVEPGSTMKIFTYATATEMNLFSPTELVDCEGKSYRFTDGRYGRTITDFHGMGVVPFEEAFFESSNIAAVKLGLRIPAIDFYDRLSRLQLTKKTGLNFPGEAIGHIPMLPWDFGARTSVPFGYEISMNSVQMAACLGCIANGGTKMAPRLVRRILSPRDETVREIDPEPQGRIFSEDTCQQMKELMEGVVVEGTGKPAAVDGYRVAGKTGTTRKTGRGDDERAYLASFAGFLPVSNPQLVIYCWIDEPSKQNEAYTGGRVAAPIFKDVATEAVRILGIKPDGEFLPQPQPTAPEENAASQAVMAESAPASMPASVPLLNPEVAREQGLMPNLMGMTKREVGLELMQLHKAKPEIEVKMRYYGSGIVVRQDPPPMMPLRGMRDCSVHFGRPAEISASQPAQTQPTISSETERAILQ